MKRKKKQKEREKEVKSARGGDRRKEQCSLEFTAFNSISIRIFCSSLFSGVVLNGWWRNCCCIFMDGQHYACWYGRRLLLLLLLIQYTWRVLFLLIKWKSRVNQLTCTSGQMNEMVCTSNVLIVIISNTRNYKTQIQLALNEVCQWNIMFVEYPSSFQTLLQSASTKYHHVCVCDARQTSYLVN